jgi:hypothetical protein
VGVGVGVGVCVCVCTHVSERRILHVHVTEINYS